MLAIVYLLGIMYSQTDNRMYLVLLLIAMIILQFRFFMQKKWRRIVVGSVILLTTFFTASMLSDRESVKRDTYLPQIYDGETVTVWGEIYRKEYKNYSYNIYISKAAVDYGDGILRCNDILVYLDSCDYSIGDVLKIEGKIKEFSTATNEGEFDLKQYYLSQKIDFALKGEDCILLAQDGYSIGHFRYGECLYKARCRLVDSLENITDEITSGVLSSMILGDKTLIDADTKSLYQASGISHVLAISGLHISILGIGLYRFLRKKGVSFLISQLLSNLIILSYAIMTGNAISTKRAVCMFILMTLANTLGRSYDMLNSLGIAVLIILIDNPFAVGYAGFVFSVVAILAIAIVVPAMSKKTENGVDIDSNGNNDSNSEGSANSNKLRTIMRNMYENNRDGFLSGLAIQLTTLPVVSFYYYEIPSYAVLLNMLVLPFLNILFISGLFASAAGLCNVTLAKIIVLPAKFILKLYELLCNAALKLPRSQIIVGKPEMDKLVLYYSLLLLGVIFIKVFSKEISNRGMWLLRTGTIMGLVIILLHHRSIGFEIDVLDVGQGDGIYISTCDNYNLFIDGGSTSEKELGKYTILPFLKSKGVRQVDYWFITHADQDHMGAVREVLEDGYKVDTFVIAQTALKDEAMLELVNEAKNYGCNLMYMRTGDVLDFGETRIKCIYPEQDAWDSMGTTDRNEMSLSLVYEDNDFKGVFCGDISEAVEQEIISNYAELDIDNEELCDVGLYKVNHHGSKYSSGKEWLDILNPTVSVISCGEKNQYGHPSKETMKRLEEKDSAIYITMDAGQISVRKEEGHVFVECFLKSRNGKL